MFQVSTMSSGLVWVPYGTYSDKAQAIDEYDRLTRDDYMVRLDRDGVYLFEYFGVNFSDATRDQPDTNDCDRPRYNQLSLC